MRTFKTDLKLPLLTLFALSAVLPQAGAETWRERQAREKKEFSERTRREREEKAKGDDAFRENRKKTQERNQQIREETRSRRGGGDKGEDLRRGRASEGHQHLEDARAKVARAVAEGDYRGFQKARQSLEKAHKYLSGQRTMGRTSDAPETKEYAEELQALEKKIYADAEDLLVNSLASETPRKEVYTGGDKEKLRAEVRSSWEKRYPGDEILEVRFHDKEWTRNKKKVWDEARKEYYFLDNSSLSCGVIVKMTEKVAVIYPAWINRNNVQGSLEVGVDTKMGGYVVGEALISKL